MTRSQIIPTLLAILRLTQTPKPNGLSKPQAHIEASVKSEKQRPVASPISVPRASSTEEAIPMSISISSIGSAIKTAVAALNASTSIAAAIDLIDTLYDATVALMQQVQEAYQSGATKKEKVLAVIKVLAGKLGVGWDAVVETVSGWIDTIKAAYNAVVSIATDAVATATATEESA